MVPQRAAVTRTSQLCRGRQVPWADRERAGLTVLRHKLFAAAVPRVVILRCPRASHNPERATTSARASKDAARAGAVTLRGSAREGARRAPQDDGSRDGVCDAVRLVTRPTKPAACRARQAVR